MLLYAFFTASATQQKAHQRGNLGLQGEKVVRSIGLAKSKRPLHASGHYKWQTRKLSIDMCHQIEEE